MTIIQKTIFLLQALIFAGLVNAQVSVESPVLVMKGAGIELQDTVLGSGQQGLFAEVALDYDFDYSHLENPKDAISLTLTPLVILTEKESGVEILQWELERLPEESAMPVVVSGFLPYSFLPYEHGSQTVRFTVGVRDQSKNLLFQSAEIGELQIEMPDLPLHSLEFGNFEVTENNYKSRQWDRPFIFGNGVPEFFWKLEEGQNDVFQSEWMEAHDYGRVDYVLMRYDSTQTYSIRVLEEDDIKKEFAGLKKLEFDSLVGKKSFDVSFGLVSDATLEIQSLKPGDLLTQNVKIQKWQIRENKLEGKLGLTWPNRKEGSKVGMESCFYLNLYADGEWESAAVFEGNFDQNLCRTWESLNQTESISFEAILSNPESDLQIQVTRGIRMDGRLVAFDTFYLPLVKAEMAGKTMPWLWIIAAILVVVGAFFLLRKK